MSPVRPSGGESLQEMIDRYNRELMKMSAAGGGQSQSRDAQHSHDQPHRDNPPAKRQEERPRQPRPEPNEPLYDRGSFLPRPEPSESLDQGRHDHGAEAHRQGMKDYAQGMEDRRQGVKDRVQGVEDRRQSVKDHMQGMEDRRQGMKDYAQGMEDHRQSVKDRMQGMEDREQGMRDREQGRRDTERGLQELRQALQELLHREEEYRRQAMRGQLMTPSEEMWNAQGAHRAVQAAADLQDTDAERRREQWLRDLEQGRRELEQGLRELEQGLKDRDQGLLEYEQGLAEREYWLNRSGRSVAASADAERSSDPTVPTVAGRVTAQSALPEPVTGESSGTLIVQVYTARRAEPVAGAQVIVTLPAENGEILYKVMSTDADGKTPPLQLPVGTSPGAAPGYSAPFLNYTVYVNADGFQPSGALTAQMFAGVTGILPVELIPGEGRGF